MEDIRIVRFDSLKKILIDEKYNVQLSLPNQQKVIDLYNKFGFELSQFDRTNFSHKDNVFFTTKNGIVPLSISNKKDESTLIFKREEEKSMNQFESEFFLKVDALNKAIDEVHYKYDFWILLSGICCIILYGIPPFIILRKKRKTNLDLLTKEYNDLVKQVMSI